MIEFLNPNHLDKLLSYWKQTKLCIKYIKINIIDMIYYCFIFILLDFISLYKIIDKNKNFGKRIKLHTNYLKIKK